MQNPVCPIFGKPTRNEAEKENVSGETRTYGTGKPAYNLANNIKNCRFSNGIVINVYVTSKKIYLSRMALICRLRVASDGFASAGKLRKCCTAPGSLQTSPGASGWCWTWMASRRLWVAPYMRRWVAPIGIREASGRHWAIPDSF